MVNPFYEKKEILAKLKEAFAQNVELPSVALGKFLTEEEFAVLDRAAGWKHETIPDQYAYATLPRQQLQEQLRTFVETFTGEIPLDEGNKRFSHRDFTLLHDEANQKEGMLGFLFLDDVPENAGGTLVFMKDGELLGSFTPAKNTFVVVRREKRAQCFFHYVNHHMGKRQLRVISA